MISERGLMKLQRSVIANGTSEGRCNVEQYLMLEVIDLAQKSFRLEREADWLAKRVESTSIMSRCRFCREGIKQHTAICQCAKTWRDIARESVEGEKA